MWNISGIFRFKGRSTYRSDDVSSEHPVRLLVAQDLDHAVGVRVGFGSAVGCKGELADSVGNSLRTRSHDHNQDGGRTFILGP